MYRKYQEKGKLNCTIKTANTIHNKRKNNRNYRDPLTFTKWTRQDLARTKILLGDKSYEEVKYEVRCNNGRIQNWESPEAIKAPFNPCYETINNGRYSSKCTYTHYTYRPQVGSYAILPQHGLWILYRYAKKLTKLSVPFGYTWTKDQNGICLISKTNKNIDYHPTSDDLRDYSKKSIREKALNLHKIRKDERKKIRAEKKKEGETLSAIKNAENLGLLLCIKDSTQAGNCFAGTMNFARNHGLDPQKHHKPTILLSLNDMQERIKLVIAVAMRRHKREISQGFCNLSDHK